MVISLTEELPWLIFESIHSTDENKGISLLETLKPFLRNTPIPPTILPTLGTWWNSKSFRVFRISVTVLLFWKFSSDSQVSVIASISRCWDITRSQMWADFVFSECAFHVANLLCGARHDGLSMFTLIRFTESRDKRIHNFAVNWKLALVEWSEIFTQERSRLVES